MTVQRCTPAKAGGSAWNSCGPAVGRRRSTCGPAHPEAVPIQGGTDVMVELNFDRRRPEALLDLTGSPSSASRAAIGDDAAARRGRALRPLIASSCRALPGLAHGRAHGRLAADPQPRHGRRQPRRRLPGRRRHPALLATGAVIEVESAARARAHDPGRRTSSSASSAARCEPDELITAVRLGPAPRAAAVLQGRHAQRDGDRRVLLRDRARSGARRSAPASARPAPTPLPGAARPSTSSPRS